MTSAEPWPEVAVPGSGVPDAPDAPAWPSVVPAGTGQRLHETERETADGAAMLDRVEAFLCRFVAFPSEDCLVAATLWAAHTHVVDAFESTPRLALLSPEPGSGKSRVLEVLAAG